MRDLVDIYAEARFGKSAAAPVAEPAAELADPKGIKAYFTMPQLTEKTLAIRNAIEESVRQEQRLKARAQALTEYARHRLAAPKAGIPGQVSDIVRALIPGLSPAASSVGAEKRGGLFSYTTPEAERKYDLLHALVAGTGAGLGAASQRGLLSTTGSQRALGKLIETAQGGAANIPGAPAELGKLIAGIMQKAQPGAPIPASTAGVPPDILNKLLTAVMLKKTPNLKGLSPAALTGIDKFLSESLQKIKPGTAGSARATLEGLGKHVTTALPKAKSLLPDIPKVLPEIARAGTLRGKLGTLKSILTRKGVPHAAALRNKLLTQLAGANKGGARLGGWKGALAGAGIVALPFAIRRWLINRQMRAQGGGAAAEAATTAEANIAAAKQLQAWRKKQIAQLETDVGPGAPAWTPHSTKPAPGPSPTSASAPGPFNRYELASYAE